MSEKKLKVNLSTSQSHLPVNQQTTVYLMLQLVQPRIEFGKQRLPVNISFVLDRSGSMCGPKMDYTRKAVQFALGNLDSNDIASLVTFDGLVEVPVPAKTAEKKEKMVQLVENIHARGTTNLSGGLLEGVSQVSSNYNQNLVNRVVLLTDGLANKGVTDPYQLTTMVKGIHSKGIAVSTLGVGSDFDEDLLVDMAEAGNGNFYFIDSPDSIPAIFEEELAGLLNVTGQNPTLQITPAENVKIAAVYNYQPTWNQGACVDLPDIYNGDTKTVLVALDVTTGDPGPVNIGTINFHYYDVCADLTQLTYNFDLSLEATTDQAMVASGVELKVHKEVELFKAAQAREDAMRDADDGNFDISYSKIKKQVAALNDLYAKSRDSEVGEQAEKLKRDMILFSEASYSPVARKKMKNASFLMRKKR